MHFDGDFLPESRPNPPQSPSWSPVRTGPDVFVEFVPHLAPDPSSNGKLFIDD